MQRTFPYTDSELYLTTTKKNCSNCSSAAIQIVHHLICKCKKNQHKNEPIRTTKYKVKTQL